MTNDEFRAWLAYHQAAFPGVAAWLEDKVPPELQPETLQQWRRAVASISLEEAKAATDKLFTETKRPYYENHPAVIAAMARRDRTSQPEAVKRRKFVDGQEVFDCRLCEDNGYLVCWHPQAIAYYRRTGNLEGFAGRTCAKACVCVEGDKYERQFGRYDPRFWVIAKSGVESEQLRQLADFLSDYKPPKPVNYEPAFDKYAGLPKEDF